MNRLETYRQISEIMNNKSLSTDDKIERIVSIVDGIYEEMLDRCGAIELEHGVLPSKIERAYLDYYDEEDD